MYDPSRIAIKPVNYIRYGKLTEKQIEAFKKVVKKAKEEKQ